jgi:hypothetical protein
MIKLRNNVIRLTVITVMQLFMLNKAFKFIFGTMHFFNDNNFKNMLLQMMMRDSLNIFKKIVQFKLVKNMRWFCKFAKFHLSCQKMTYDVAFLQYP